MMEYKYYIKKNANDFITEFFSSWQEEMFDGNEIEVGEGWERIYHLDIHDDYGWKKLKYIASQFIQATIDEIIENDLNRYKKEKKQELKGMIQSGWPLEIDKTMVAIRAKWQSFKAQAATLTTKQQVDNAFDQAVAWLGLEE